MTKTKQLLVVCTLLLWAVGASAQGPWNIGKPATGTEPTNAVTAILAGETLATMSTEKTTVNLFVIWRGNGTLTANGTALTYNDWTNGIPVIDGNVSLIATGDVQLTFLYCYNNQLTKLDVTACTDLEYLHCDNNQLTELNVTACTELVYLTCSYNQLTELDVTACTKLKDLDCYNNQLTELDVTACTKLTMLYANDQNITIPQEATAIDGILSINNPISYNGSEVTTITGATAENGKIVWSNLTGTSGTATCSFATSLPEGVVGGGAAFSGTLTQTWAALPVVTLATMSTANATVSLLVIWRGNGALTANGTALTNYGYTNDIPVIDGNVSLIATGDVQLTFLYCYNNQLTKLDVTACTDLEYLHCYNNQLTELDVTACTELKNLYCYNNQLTELDVTACTKLTQLFCEDNQLTELDVTACTELKNLHCYNNQLTELNVTACTELVYLKCYKNQLTELNVTACIKLTHLECHYNQLTELNVTPCTELKNLHCYNNQLTELDVTACTKLTHLYCYENQLTELNVAACTKLEYLLAHDQNITITQEATAIDGTLSINNPISYNGSEVTTITDATAENGKIVWNGLTGERGTATCSFATSLPEGVAGAGFSGTLAQAWALPPQVTLATMSTENTTVNLGVVWSGNGTLTANGTALTNGGWTNYIPVIDGNVRLVATGDVQLTELHSNSNQLTALDVTACTELVYLFCDNNQLTELDVMACTELVGLLCYDNQLTDLNVTACTKLTQLYCSNNQLTELDVIACTKLETLSARNQNITIAQAAAAINGTLSIDNPIRYNGSEVTFITGATAENGTLVWSDLTGTSGTATCSFATSLPEGVTGSAFSGTITQAWQSAVTLATMSTEEATVSLYVRWSGNGTLTANGTALTNGGWTYYIPVIDGNVNLVATDDVQLTVLDCSNNRLTELNVTACTELVNLYCYGSQLAELNVSACTELVELHCYNSQLQSLNVRTCAKLEELHCYNNQLTQLDVTACTELLCYNNQLTDLNVTGCTKLAKLRCYNNQLQSLNVRTCAKLEELHCEKNQLSSLDVTACTELKMLFCYNNQLTDLNVTACTKLERLYSHEQNITITQEAPAIDGTLSINNPIRYNGSEVTTIEDATAENDKIVWNDLTGTSGRATCSFATTLPEGVYGTAFSGTLTQVWGALPQVTLATMGTEEAAVSFYVVWSGNGTLTANGTALTNGGRTNDIPVIDSNVSLVATGDVQLTVLHSNSNQLTALDVTACTELVQLNCEYNLLTELDVSACSQLTKLHCYNNQLTKLGVAACTKLTQLFCQNNQLTKLDVSVCTELVELFCQNNQLTKLDVSACTELEYLFANNQNIFITQLVTAIDGTLAIDNPISYNGSEVTTIDGATVENGKIVWNGLTGTSGTATCSFSTSLPESVTIGSAFSGTLTQEWSLPQVTLATMSTENATVYLFVIWSGNGTLTANGTPLTNNDLTNDIPVIDGKVNLVATGDVQLTYLICSNNQLTNLDVRACTKLTYLYCEENQLSALDVSSCTELKMLTCSYNQLESLDVSDLEQLMVLACNQNSLTILEVNDNLQMLFADYNQLSLENLYALSSKTGGYNDLMIPYIGRFMEMMGYPEGASLILSPQLFPEPENVVVGEAFTLPESLSINETDTDIEVFVGPSPADPSSYTIDAENGTISFNEEEIYIVKFSNRAIISDDLGGIQVVEHRYQVNPVNFTVSGIDAKYPYTGSPIEPSVEVKGGDTILIEDMDYTVEYSNNIEMGTATITITGMGYYCGTIRLTFEIIDEIGTAIPDVSSETAIVVGYYTISGQRLMQEPESGTYIKLYSDGNAEKVMK